MSDLTTSILIVTYNSAEDIAACLDSIAAHAPAPGCETVVVDNASADGTADMVRERYPWVRLIASDRNLGFAGGNNLAARESIGDVLLLLNPDALLLPGTVETLARALDERPGAQVTGACHVDGRGELARCWGDFPDLWWVFANQAPWRRIGIPLRSRRVVGRTCEGVTGTIEADWVSGACFMVRRDVWERLGGLDEEYFLYFEETDFCSRVWRAGGRVLLVTAARIVHLEGASVGNQSEVQLRRFMEGLFLFLKKRNGRLAGLAARGWVWLVNYLLYLLVKRRQGADSEQAAHHLGLMRAAAVPAPERPAGTGVLGDG